jgi:hypothetical protein
MAEAPTLEAPKPIDESLVGDGDGFRQAEPTYFGALTGARARLPVFAREKVAKVEVYVRPRWMDIEVEQGWLSAEETCAEPGLLRRFPDRGLPRQLANVDVPTGLQPYPERLVTMEHGAPPASDNGGTCHVYGCTVPVEGPVKEVKLAQELVP